MAPQVPVLPQSTDHTENTEKVHLSQSHKVTEKPVGRGETKKSHTRV